MRIGEGEVKRDAVMTAWPSGRPASGQGTAPPLRAAAAAAIPAAGGSRAVR